MQNNKIISIVIIALVVGLGVGYGVGVKKYSPKVVADVSTGTHMMRDGSMMGGDGKMSMQESMASMNAGLKGKTGDAFDQAFLTEMIVHHEGAVEMARSALTNAKHQEIKDLASAIISAQNKEIAEMKAWQKIWYGQR